MRLVGGVFVGWEWGLVMRGERCGTSGEVCRIRYGVYGVSNGNVS